MRINRYIAQATGMSRRSADTAVANGTVKVNGLAVAAGYNTQPEDVVTLDAVVLTFADIATIMLNKPVGYVCSRDGQGSKTIYELLPKQFHALKSIGRLDKYSSGLLLLTNDGELANQLTHPSFQKEKVYEITLNKFLSHPDQLKAENGVMLDDGLSKLKLNGKNKNWTITMNEGRNRQIRRTFDVLGYEVIRLHRAKFGPYQLSGVALGSWQKLK